MASSRNAESEAPAGARPPRGARRRLRPPVAAHGRGRRLPVLLRARRRLPGLGRRRQRVHRPHVLVRPDRPRPPPSRRSKRRRASRCSAATASTRRPACWVELAEHLVGITPFADWAAFAKNGSDVCTWAVAVAREHTGRRKVVKADGAYHGAHAWCTPAPAGVTPEDTANVLTFPYNDLESLRARRRRAPRRRRRDHRQPVPPRRLPRPGAARRGLPARRAPPVRRARHRPHSRRRARRLPPPPRRLGRALRRAARPRLLRQGAGQRLPALRLRRPRARSRTPPSASTSPARTSPAPCRWPPPSPACASSKPAAPSRTWSASACCCSAASRRRPPATASTIVYSGPPAIPFMSFKDDVKFGRSRAFAAACAEGGVYLAPYHNWFLSAAHSETRHSART